MRFSEHFRLGLHQAQLDFVDIELEKDQPLFIDPYALQLCLDPWAARCTQSLRVYFQSLVDAIRADRDDLALDLLASLHEPKETRLGLSSVDADGNAIGDDLARALLAALKGSRAIQTGLLRDLSDAELFVHNIGRDRISDLSTNVIRRELIEYTQQQCRLYGVDMRPDVASGDMWDVESRQWISEHVDLPVANGEKILLVPKRIVRWTTLLTPREFYDGYVLDFLRARELHSPSLGLVRMLKNGGRRVTKKELREVFPFSKDFLADFSQSNPEVLENYKRAKAAKDLTSCGQLDVDFDEALFAAALIDELRGIAPGGSQAHVYHKFIKGTLEFLFFPALSNPSVEREINDGRKRIDITFLNTDRTGFFFLFPNTTRRTATEIIVECKNYTGDMGNPEVDQIAMRFADHRGWLGLLVCRAVQDIEKLVLRCRDVVQQQRGYVLPITDEDVIAMLAEVVNGRRIRVADRLDRIFQSIRG